MMQTIRRVSILAAALTLLVAGAWLFLERTQAAVFDPAGSALAAAPTPAAAGRPTQRLRDDATQNTAISFIESPTATCWQRNLLKDECYMNWVSLSVVAYPSYVISMTISIDDRLRARYHGFFQTNFSFEGDLNGKGFRVSCGTPGTAGISGLGMAHSYTIRARASDGLSAANYGSVICPAGPRRSYLPLTRR
jgi:hypothetical protein